MQIKKIVPFSAEDMYNMVIDVESYQHYLPFVESSISSNKKEGECTSFLSDITLMYRGLHKQFTSHVTGINALGVPEKRIEF
jgi:ribosome-associated toxin RatA of RatAB toxin-antitoxin module